MRAGDEAREIGAEARSTAEIADRLANGGSPEDADQIRSGPRARSRHGLMSSQAIERELKLVG